MTRKYFFIIMGLCVGTTILSSCAARRGVKVKKDGAAQVALSTSAAGAYTPPVEVTEAGLRGKEFFSVSGLRPAVFDYDSFELREETREILKRNAEYLKSQKGREALVAGHCDERGTVAYNLALGQKRAKEVREYYIRLGVPGKALATISYGKEKPACAQSNEECWLQNRRADTSLRSK